MTTAETTATPKRSIIQSSAAQKLLAFAALIIIFLVFAALEPRFFPTWENVKGILLATAVNGVLALGVTFVITTAGIDLSVGTLMAFSAVMTALSVTVAGLPLPIGIVIGILTGTTFGLLNGILISRMKIPPFIATLGTMMIARGLALVLSTIEGFTVKNVVAVYQSKVGEGMSALDSLRFAFSWLETGSVKPIYFDGTPIFRQITMGSILDPLLAPIVPGFNIPNAVLILFIAALIAAFILAKTVLGRYTVAIGSNEEATRLSGVNVANWKTAVYALGGTFSGLAGVMIASRLNSAQPATGVGYELEAIAAVVIGGTSLSGGEGTILGTIIGAFIISTLTNGLRIMNVPQEWQFVVTGLIVILAVYLDILRRRRT